ncbi:MAG: hypothetical protein HOK60_01470 [Planctomycetes bacterium]|nr:hypothetical protein [Planctomycetota bacterium]
MMGTKSTSGIGRFTAILSVGFFSLCILVGVASSGDRDSSRLKSDAVEPGFGAIDGTEDSAGVGDAIGDAIGDDTPAASDGSTAGAIGADDSAADAPADDVPADDAPADDAPADDAPADDAPADDAPADDAPATDAPADQPTGDDGSGN